MSRLTSRCVQIVITFLACLLLSPAWADEAPALENLKVFKDESGVMSLGAVNALLGNAADQGSRSYPDVPAIDSQGQPVWWLRATMRNSSRASLPVILSLDDVHIGTADFYVQRGTLWTHPAAPDLRRYPALTLTLAPLESVPVLIRMTSKDAFRLRPALRTEAAWDAWQSRAALWDGSLFGGLLALAWSAFLIAVFSRNRAFFLLAALCVTITLFEAAFRGYLHVYLWHTGHQFDNRVSHLSGSLILILFIAFVLSVARGENTRLPARRLLLMFVCLEGVTAAGYVLSDSSFFTQFDLWLHAAVEIVMIAITVVLVVRRAPTAKLMLITMAFSFFNLLIRVLELTANWGIHPPVPWISPDIYPNPVIALGGLATNLAVLAAWIRHVGRQRSEARKKLAMLQQTEQARLREEVRMRTAELDHALAVAQEKNQQKIEMVGYIGHDLRAPLATISGYLKLIGDTAASGQSQILNAIDRSVNYQLSLIDELMEYTKAELAPLDIHAQSTDLPALLADIVEYAVALCSQHDNQFRYELSTAIPVSVCIDPTRIQQVLLNLLSNASKFTRKGSVTLTIEARRPGTDDDAWRLAFTVSDTGIGMDLSQAHDIFGAYQQLQQVSAGTGLGLFIAQRLVHAMGGTLRVESSPEQGSRFSFEIAVPALAPSLVGPQSLNYPATRNVAVSGTKSSSAGGSRDNFSLSDFQELALLARNGRLSDIEKWMSSASHFSDSDTFLRQVRQHLDKLDFHGLERLAVSFFEPTSLQGP